MPWKNSSLLRNCDKKQDLMAKIFPKILCFFVKKSKNKIYDTHFIFANVQI